MKCRIFNTFLVPALALFSIPGLALAGNHLSDYKKRRESVPLNRFNLASKGGAKVYRSC